MICAFWFVSCDNSDDIKLIDPSYKTLELSCGYDFEVPVLTDNWNIESVRYMPSGEVILDKNDNPLTLNGNGEIEASNGWLILKRETKDKFIVNLKENFDPLHERVFVICINSNEDRDYVTITQQAGVGYKLVKSVYDEIEEKREIYTSKEGCSTLTLSNNTSEAVWKPTGYVFEDVVIFSSFESNDYGAFNWMPEGGVNIGIPDLIINNKIYSTASNIYTYKEGSVETPYIKDIPNGNKILIPPYSTIYLGGEITYCKRVCNYTLTIQNIGSGTQFEINGTWTQIVPISSHTISSDKPFNLNKYDYPLY
jgi:hypothetical protein